MPVVVEEVPLTDNDELLLVVIFLDKLLVEPDVELVILPNNELNPLPLLLLEEEFTVTISILNVGLLLFEDEEELFDVIAVVLVVDVLILIVLGLISDIRVTCFVST